MSSLVFTLEGRPTKRWGLYGSFVLATANIGTLLGGLVAYLLRMKLTDDQIYRWGWRIPFLSGIMISFCGIYLKYFCSENEGLPGHEPIPSHNCEDDVPKTQKSEMDHEIDDIVIVERDMPDDDSDTSIDERPKIQVPVNPLRLAFSAENRRSLMASSMIPLLWAGGFYLSFVWMAIYMKDLIAPPVTDAFLVNSVSSLILCIWFPFAGLASDIFWQAAGNDCRRRAIWFRGAVFVLGYKELGRLQRVGRSVCTDWPWFQPGNVGSTYVCMAGGILRARSSIDFRVHRLQYRTSHCGRFFSVRCNTLGG